MEHSISSLAFKGSIVEAITVAKQEKKLFVVYLANDNQDSKHLETSTWTDPSVSETVTKYCILLHILEGSSEASQFSAIYPQNSAPSITAIGYNGIRLWQSEGIVAAEVLASSLEKAWFILHVQETTAALSSEQNCTSHTSENVSSEQDTPSSNESSSSSSIPDHISSLNVGQLNSETIEERNRPEEYKEADGEQNNEASLKAPHASVGLNESTSHTMGQNTSLDPHQTDPNKSEKPDSPVSGDPVLGQVNDPPNNVAKEAIKVVETKNSEIKEVEKGRTSDSPAVISNDVFLNIKMPNGSSLQVKFTVMDTLKMVKDYISENSTSKIGFFDLAIPYPNKVFNEQELFSTLSSLGIFNRQILVVVPRQQPHNSVSKEASKVVKTKTSDTKEVEKAHTSPAAVITNDVFLNIKMPDGSSLQVKFSVMDTLSMVKDYISENSAIKVGSFDLAIPYPRKVFNEQELIRTLSSLGLFNRQALVVIPRKPAYYRFGGGSSSSSPSYSSSNEDAGYWASVRRIVSYVNPFSYFTTGGATSDGAQGSQSGTRQYSQNLSLGNNLRGAGTAPTDPSSDQNQNGTPANVNGSRQKTSGFGGNIHTLKRNEDDERFNDRNAFWNGNSTEYGGGDNDGR